MASPGYSQRPDSLLQASRKAGLPDTTRVMILAKLANAYQEASMDTAVQFATKGLELARSINYEKGKGGCLQQLGLADLKRNVPERAVKYYGEALKSFEQAGYAYGQVSAILSMADIYYRQSKYDKALEYYRQGIELAHRNDDAKHAGLALLSIGGLYSDLSNYSEALKYYLQALPVFERQNDREGMAMAYTNIATVYSTLGDHKKALSYIGKGMEIERQNGNKEGMLFNVVNTGIVYGEMKDYNNALIYFEKALKLADTLEDANWQLVCMNNVAEAYYYLGKKAEAEARYKDVLKLTETVSDIFITISAHEGLGKILVETGRVSEGIIHLKQAYKLAMEKGIKESIFKAAKGLSEAYAKTNPALALDYYKVYAEYEDSVYNDKNDKRIHQLQYEYELGKKETQIALLEKDKALARSREERNVVLVGALLTGIASLVLIVLLLLRSRAAEKRSKELISQQKDEIEQQARRLEDLNTFKDKTFTVLSHDLRDPLSSFTTTMMLLDEGFITSEKFASLKPALNEQLNSLNALLDSLLKWSGSYMRGQAVAIPERTDLGLIVKQCMSLLQPVATQKDIVIEDKIRENTIACCDPAQIEIVIRNLMTNAIKFTGRNGRIMITAFSTEKGATLSVADTGVGMTAGQLDTLFQPTGERNTYGTHGERGLGVGLLLCKEFIDANKGSIAVNSMQGKGTTFTLQLPAA
ncbi:MAG: tetratricopeptide repeat-containing sensor histidine kinase [Bacteroidota bacterium]